MAAIKMNRCYHDMLRRTWGIAAMKDGEWGEPKQALVPDDYDDIRAKTSGGISADYYGVGLMAAGRGVVGFIEQFRHLQPLRTTPAWGTYGNTGRPDVSLAYQSDEGAQWVHMPGRPDFLTHDQVPWARDGMYVGSNVEEFGQEQRLYFTGSMGGHMPAMPGEDCLGAIGFAAWPKSRLFGFCARPEGVLDVELGRLKEPRELVLNCKAATGGNVRVEILTMKPYYELTPSEGKTPEDAVPLEGDNLEAVVRWKRGSVIQPVGEGERVLARLHVQGAEVFAFELRPVR